MRDISPTHLSAQNFEQTIGGQGGMRKAYVELIFHGTESFPDYSGRHKGIMLKYFLYSGSGVITLANDDHEVEWMVGYWIEPVMGDYIFDNDGNITDSEKKPLPRLWVVSQQDVSFPGAKYVVLELSDAWKLLKESDCIIPGINETPPFHFEDFQNWVDVTYDRIISLCLDALDFGHGAIEESDGIIDAPIDNPFYINEHYYDLLLRAGKVSDGYKGVYESFFDIIYKALSRTYTYLITKGGSEKPQFEFVYPVEGEADITYYSYKDPYFYEFVYRKNVVSPNFIVTYCNWDNEIDPPNFNPLITGSAEESGEYPTVKQHIWIPEISDQTNAVSIAGAYLEREKLKSKGGRLITPLDIRVELLDLIRVDDNR